jgi:hypothetical protein
MIKVRLVENGNTEGAPDHDPKRAPILLKGAPE